MDFVVNCFHFSVSLGYTTTVNIYQLMRNMLWIAFIFQYLWDTQQLYRNKIANHLCCELLSFFSIFGIHNNFCMFLFVFKYVVNCFHFSVSLGYTTTYPITSWCAAMLWIAFIFQYLWDTQQPIFVKLDKTFSCELLSFFSIFGIHNNNPIKKVLYLTVVNCFHFSVSLGYTTTIHHKTVC